LGAPVRQISYDILVYHGHGHLEKVYENVLAHRLRKVGLDVRQQYPIQVYDEDGTLIGDSYADLLVEGWLIAELKTAKALVDEHSAQVLGSLKSARLEHGLLINFCSYKFELRKFAWLHEAARRKSKPSILFSALCVLCVLCGLIAEELLSCARSGFGMRNFVALILKT
jgi:GxxExxY protein